MEKLTLDELNTESREEVIYFLKKLWNSEDTNCPICGQKLELLHKKAKKNNVDWQCKNCDKKIDTIYLLNQLNDKL